VSTNCIDVLQVITDTNNHSFTPTAQPVNITLLAVNLYEDVVTKPWQYHYVQCSKNYLSPYCI